MPRRFFSEAPLRGDSVTLTDTEAHHLLHVMRAQVGDRVVLFDGRGWECGAEVTELKRKEVALAIDTPRPISRELGIHLELVVALPRGDRQEWLIQKAVELGVTRLVPWVTEHSVVQPKAKTILKLRRVVIEASKQCGRNWLMEVTDPTSFGEYLESEREGVRLLAHPAGKGGIGSPAVARECVETQRVCLGVGPEGGLSEQEVESAVQAGWTTVDLGPRILRVETAAIALVTLAGLGAAHR